MPNRTAPRCTRCGYGPFGCVCPDKSNSTFTGAQLMSKQGTSVVKCLECRQLRLKGSICSCQSNSLLAKSLGVTDERMNQVTQVNKIDAFQVEGMLNVQQGDVLIHHSGRKYFVNSISNIKDTEKFPKSVVYVEWNVPHPETYSRPVKELVRTMFNVSYHGDRVDATK